MRNTNTKNLVIAALMLAIGQVLPFITGQIPEIGQMLCPMHYPVLLCGFLCGWQYGALIGFICPLLRSVLFGMPPMFPNAVAMAFELCTYGLISGLLWEKTKKKDLLHVYPVLLTAMVAGRIVWGLAEIVLLSAAGNAFTMQMFLAGALLNAIPGIIGQLILIPVVIRFMQLK